jgi:biopolymer transport protein ExbD
MISKPGSPTGAPHAAAGGPSALTEERPKRKRRRGPDTRVAALAIVPFMDMSYTLLLFLVLAASFTEGEGALTANLPLGTGGGGAGEVELPKVQLAVTLHPKGANNVGATIAIEGLPDAIDNFTALYAKLRELSAKGGGPYTADTQVIIKPTQDVRWDNVVNAFNAAVRLNFFKNVGFQEAQ